MLTQLRNGRLPALFLIALCFALDCRIAAGAQAREPFFQDKTIRIVVGRPSGDVYDIWARLLAGHLGRHIQGNPKIIVQNISGKASIMAANHVYNVGEPDGLTLGMSLPSVYFDQLLSRKEVEFVYAKFTWIGSPVKGEQQMYMRADSPYKTVEDVRTAAEPPKCGSTGTGSSSYYLPRLMEEVLGAKFTVVTGYQGDQDIDLAVERGEVQCRAFAIEAFFAREPFDTWRKTGFVHNLMQTGRKRDKKLPSVPTIHELMDQYKTPESGRRLATVVLSGDALGRPLFGTPGIPRDRVIVLRAAFTKTMTDPEFLAKVNKQKYELDPTAGEELEKLAKEMIAQPPEIVERLRSLLGK
jgi:tripartite-type tricarboxylate transporter receptor subunit TctC